jgi:hypothetical protein
MLIGLPSISIKNENISYLQHFLVAAKCSAHHDDGTLLGTTVWPLLTALLS